MTAALTAAAAAFNLVCTGTQATSQALAPPTSSLPFSVVYRVDLERGRWCSGDCSSTNPFYSVTVGEIVFRSQTEETVRYVTKVNRESGAYTDALLVGDRLMITTGKCVKAPFTGLPEQRF